MTHDDAKSFDDGAAPAVWSAIKAQPLAMMTTMHEGEFISRPMAAHADADAGLIYFVSQLESEKTHDIGSKSPVNLSFSNPDKSTFVSIAGHATISQDREKLRALWNMWSEAWLPDGPDSPDTALITVDPGQATIWDNDGSKIVRTIKTATAALTQSPPDVGKARTVEL